MPTLEQLKEGVKIISETELDGWNLKDDGGLGTLAGGMYVERWPFPDSVLRGFTEITPGIIKVDVQNRSIRTGDIFAYRMMGPRAGAETVFWPSPVPKVLYLAGLEREAGSLLPDYDHSCKQLDDKLMRSVPNTFFTDLSRVGFGGGLVKPYGYVDHTFAKQNQASAEGKMPSLLIQFYKRYGMVGCVPLTSRSSMFDYIERERLDSYLVPGTSVTEAFTSLMKSFGSHRIYQEISSMKGNSWTEQSERNGTNKLMEAFYGYLFTNYPNLLFALYTDDHAKIINDYIAEYAIGPENDQPVTTLIASIVMQMINSAEYKLPVTSQAKDNFWAQKVYGRSPLLANMDVSELVVARPQTDTILKPIPWQAFVLFGGNTSNYAPTYEQLVANAELIQEYYPGSTIFLMVDPNDKPLVYDTQREKQILQSKVQGVVTKTSSALQGIAELTLGEDIHKGLIRNYKNL